MLASYHLAKALCSFPPHISEFYIYRYCNVQSSYSSLMLRPMSFNHNYWSISMCFICNCIFSVFYGARNHFYVQIKHCYRLYLQDTKLLWFLCCFSLFPVSSISMILSPSAASYVQCDANLFLCAVLLDLAQVLQCRPCRLHDLHQWVWYVQGTFITWSEYKILLPW